MSLSLAARLKAWFYLFPDGYVFASRGFVSKSAKFSVTLVLSMGGEPFELESEGRKVWAHAAVVRPCVVRRLAAHAPIVSVGISPSHRQFRVFSTQECTEPFKVLPRAEFSGFDDALQAAGDGLLSAPGAQRLADAAMHQVAARFAPPGPLDARVGRAAASIDSGACSMDLLAKDVGLSYHRLSHLFSSNMGIPLRSYVLARKLDLAATLAGSGLSLTEIALAAGFADSAHFSKMWMRVSGATPSHFFNSDQVALRSVFTGG